MTGHRSRTTGLGKWMKRKGTMVYCTCDFGLPNAGSELVLLMYCLTLVLRWILCPASIFSLTRITINILEQWSFLGNKPLVFQRMHDTLMYDQWIEDDWWRCIQMKGNNTQCMKLIATHSLPTGATFVVNSVNFRVLLIVETAERKRLTRLKRALANNAGNLRGKYLWNSNRLD